MANMKLWEQYFAWKTECEWVDLSHRLSPRTPHWSGFPDMNAETYYDYEKDGFFSQKFDIVSQYGTHVDAPCHFVKGAVGLDAFVAAELVMPLCVLDITQYVKNDVDYAVTPQVVLDWEAAYGEIPRGAFVAARSDWSKREDMDNRDAEGNKRYPGWGLDVLKLLIEGRGVGAIGHETSDTDTAVGAATSGFLCEYYLLEQGRFQIELMKNLDRVPPAGSLVFCGFPRAEGAPGFTARCIALCPKTGDASSHTA